VPEKRRDTVEGLNRLRSRFGQENAARILPDTGLTVEELQRLLRHAEGLADVPRRLQEFLAGAVGSMSVLGAGRTVGGWA
jgi:hypothetical protein